MRGAAGGAESPAHFGFAAAGATAATAGESGRSGEDGRRKEERRYQRHDFAILRFRVHVINPCVVPVRIDDGRMRVFIGITGLISFRKCRKLWNVLHCRA